MAQSYTKNYNLDKYVGTDKPNLRDQYNSAMDKIDTEFTKIAGQHTDTANQIAAINTNINTNKQNIQHNSERITQNVNIINDNKRRIGLNVDSLNTLTTLANANKHDIKTLTTLLNEMKELTVYEARQWNFDANGIIQLSALSSSKTYALQQQIPDWANFMDVYLVSSAASYFKENATAIGDRIDFTTPMQIETFPLKRVKKEQGTTNIITENITDFVLLGRGVMGVNSQGLHQISFSNIPFTIKNNTLSQSVTNQMDFAPFKNNGNGITITMNALDNFQTASSGTTALIYKIIVKRYL